VGPGRSWVKSHSRFGGAYKVAADITTIGAIANERDLNEFLNKCLEDFNTTFNYELSKYDNTFPSQGGEM
jgi:hypothetical protein